MKLSNCINCLTHYDNRETKWENWNECVRHKFVISDKVAQRYDWSIDYIKKEVKNSRHIVASLGSAGFTFMDDIRKLANYAYTKGDKTFYNSLLKCKA